MSGSVQRMDVTKENLAHISQLLQHASSGAYDSTLALDATVNANLRLNALICLKNSIRSYWNRHATDSSASAELAEAAAHREQERQTLRAAILDRLFQETSQPMVNQLKDALGHISTVDFPKDWPALVPTITAALASAAGMLSTGAAADTDAAFFLAQRSFDALCEVLERRKPVRKHMIVAILTDHIDALHQHWSAFIGAFLHAIATLQAPQTAAGSAAVGAAALATASQLAKVCRAGTRALSLTVVECNQGVCTSPLGQTLFPNIAEVMTTMTKFQHELPCVDATHALRTDLRDLRAYAAEMVIQTQHQSPLLFSPFLGPFLALFKVIIDQRAIVRDNKLARFAATLAAASATEGSFAGAFDIGDDQDEGSGNTKGNDGCSMQAFNFFCSVLLSGVYRGSAVASAMGSAGGLQFSPEAASQAQTVLRTFFSDATVTSLCQVIITSYLPWTQHDLTDWATDAKSFFGDYRYRRSDSDERAAALALLHHFGTSHGEIVGNLLMSGLGQAAADEEATGGPTAGLVPSSSAPGTVVEANVTAEQYIARFRKDALLHAVGTCVFDVKESFNASALYQHVTDTAQRVLAAVGCAGLESGGANIAGNTGAIGSGNGTDGPQAALSITTAPSAVLALYRCVWVAGELTEVIPQEQLPQLVALSFALLQVPDLFLALSSSLSLRVFVDCALFDAAGYAAAALPSGDSPMTASFQLILSLCQRCGNADSVTHLLGIVTKTVEAVGSHVSQAVPMLVDALPKLWAAGATESTLKARVVDTLSHLTVALGARSQDLHGIMLDVLSACLDPNSPDHTALFEQGLELWQNVLAHATAPSQQLLQVFSHWVTYYSEYEDYFDEAVTLFESHILLFGDTLFVTYGPALCGVVQSLLARVNDSSLNILSSVLGFVAQVCPLAFLSSFAPCLPELLHALLTYISTANNPAAGDGDSAALPVSVLYKYANTLGQLLLRCPTELTAALAAAPPVPVEAAAQGLGWLDVIVAALLTLQDEFPAGYPRRVRAMALAAALALPGQSCIMARAGDILSACAEEVAEQSQEDEVYDGSALAQTPLEQQTEEFRIERATATDAVNQVTLRDYVVQALEKSAQVWGGEAVNAALGALDPMVIAPLRLR